MTIAEFVLPQAKQRNRASVNRWILSHTMDHLWIVLMTVVGAFGNAALAAAVPVFLGQAFDIVIAGQDVQEGLARIAILIVVTQVIRSVLQLGRNFGADLLSDDNEVRVGEPNLNDAPTSKLSLMVDEVTVPGRVDNHRQFAGRIGD